MNLKEALIENNSISLQCEVKNWKEAIKVGTDLLEKSGAITENYYKSIIENTEKYGPYYIIVPGVAMPHARPEAGVKRDSFSLVTLKEPVIFERDGEKEEVCILITLAATSSENHNEFGIVQVADLFEDEENIEKIKSAKSIEEILNLMN
ncbi:PTS sugar transporter subunit IIA [Fusobacterium sp.]|uniref:PTS sugar transporter subunit IIA n=1 Tax=Fusobacterium sp. TaxID=68766 RepID=UPI0025BF17BD|nr:PTS sugar transporter subunit IIA [Fusobacterium sp.]